MTLLSMVPNDVCVNKKTSSLHLLTTLREAAFTDERAASKAVRYTADILQVVAEGMIQV